MHRILEVLQGGGRAVGVMLQEADKPFAPQLIAAAGYDFVFIDMEHGAYGFQDVVVLAQVARLAGVTPIVRPPDHSYAGMARALDAGALGLMIPRVRNGEEAAAIVRSMRFPPLGERGMAGQRGHTGYKPVNRLKFVEQMNREILLLIQIELEESVERIEEILSVPGVDAVFVGPGDLSVSLGCDSLDDPKVEAAIEKVVKACVRRGIPCGIQHADLDALSRWAKAGMRIFSPGTDVSLLAEALTEKRAEISARLTD